MLLAALMLVSCLSPAFAEEGEQARTDYERWGSYLNWTDGQKAEAFHNWDDERWDAILDACTEEELLSLINYGAYHTLPIESIGLPATLHGDGPSGFT